MALQQDDSKSSESVRQWVTSIINVESKSRDNLSYLNSILGPITENLSHYNGSTSSVSDSDLEINQQPILNESKRGDGFFTHEIIFKINEKVFIESLNIYEKVVADSSILKIEALEIDENKGFKKYLFFKFLDYDYRNSFSGILLVLILNECHIYITFINFLSQNH